MDKTDPAPRKIIIAIDGPAGSGKSTLASLLARKYNYTNIETGAMYRALALKALEAGISFDDEAALSNLARNSRIELQARPEGNRVLLDGKDITGRIREQDVTDALGISCIGFIPRAMGAGGGVVMEGRDIGTKVFPHAEVKIFLDAAPEVRSNRRFLQNPVVATPEQSVLEELRKRDLRDRTRANSPLVPAADAIVIDSTNLNLEQVFNRTMEIIESVVHSVSHQTTT